MKLNKRKFKTMEEARKNKFDLENRLIEFAVSIVKIVESMSKSLAGRHLASQLIRSGTSPALNYGEAQSSESRNDFIHKMKIGLKELRETHICLQLIDRLKLSRESDLVISAMKENNELISIFVKSLKTANANSLTKKSLFFPLLRHSTFNIHHSAFTLPPPFKIRHSSFIIRHSLFLLQHSTFNIRYSTFNILLPRLRPVGHIRYLRIAPTRA